MSLTKWDERYLEMAELVSTWSKDPSSKIGAVIVRKNRVIAVGFNGFPTGVIDHQERLEKRKIKYEMIVHAEENALIVAGKNSEGATIYVHGQPVCPRCAASIIQAGIKRVVAKRPSIVGHELEKEDWNLKGKISLDMFSEAGINFHSPTPELHIVADSKPSDKERPAA